MASAGAATAASFPVLTVLVLVPVLGALLVSLLSDRRPEYVRLAALASSVVTAGVSLWMLSAFDSHEGGFQFVSRHAWIDTWGISW
ncbi:MAG: Fe-S-binding domain-containing protein, partial [Acidimicrobiales bacterium]